MGQDVIKRTFLAHTCGRDELDHLVTEASSVGPARCIQFNTMFVLTSIHLPIGHPLMRIGSIRNASLLEYEQEDARGQHHERTPYVYTYMHMYTSYAYVYVHAVCLYTYVVLRIWLSCADV